MPSGIVAGSGQSKDDVRYRHYLKKAVERCSSCVHFYPLNSCEIIKGNISSEGLCDMWTMENYSQGKDGAFYKEQYEKAKKVTLNKGE